MCSVWAFPAYLGDLGGMRGRDRPQEEEVRGSCLLISLSDPLPPAAACRLRRQAMSHTLPAYPVTYSFAHGAGAWRLGRAESRVGCVRAR